jgi:hypothetical protein
MGRERISLMIITIYSGHRYKEELHSFLTTFSNKMYVFNITQCYLIFILNLGLDMSCFALITCFSVCVRTHYLHYYLFY